MLQGLRTARKDRIAPRGVSATGPPSHQAGTYVRRPGPVPGALTSFSPTQMRRFTTLLVTAALLAAPVAAQAQSGSIAGTFALDRAASDNVDQAIAKAVRGMNFITKPIAKGRLQKTNQPYQQVAIATAGGNTVVTIDKQPPRQAPSDGTPVNWTRPDGEKMKLSMKWVDGKLVETFKPEDGQRTNTYSLSEDGTTLTMNVEITSPRLSKPLTYKLVFRKA